MNIWDALNIWVDGEGAGDASGVMYDDDAYGCLNTLSTIKTFQLPTFNSSFKEVSV